MIVSGLVTPPTLNMASSDSEEYLSAEEEESNKTDSRLSSVMNGLSLTEKGQDVSSKTDKTQSRHAEPTEEDTNVDTNNIISQEASATSCTSRNEHVSFTNTKTDSSINSFEVRTDSTTNACKQTHTDTNRQAETEDSEFVSNLDNRYVSEGVEVKGEKVELTEEQIKEMKEQAGKLKNSGNEAFKSGDFEKAIDLYSEALKVYPSECVQEIAICHANRGACYMKLEQHQDVVDDCTKALELKSDYLKAIMRRAQSYEALDKLEEALEDYKKALEMDPSQSIAREAVIRLPQQIKEQHEKLKEEMIGKLKELGNAVLKPFGLSTNNFQLNQDPNTGGYSINFKK